LNHSVDETAVYKLLLPLPRWTLCDQVSSYVILCIQVYCKSNPPISLKLDVVIGPTKGKKRSTFGGDPVPDTDSDHFSTSLTIAKYGILGDLLALLIQSPADFNDTGKMIDADKTFLERSSTHLDPNPKIRI